MRTALLVVIEMKRIASQVWYYCLLLPGVEKGQNMVI